MTWISEFDISVLRWIHHNRLEPLDDTLYFISFSTTFISIALLITLLFISIKNKSNELRSKFFQILIVLVFASVLSFTLKHSIIRERPFKIYSDITKLSEAGNSSFPSGHTAEAFALAMAITLLFPHKKFAVPIFLWAILVAYSRMALGVHYPFDILGGILLGTTISFVTIFSYNELKKWKSR
ncbi:MAG: phosphatase PAP2 family protein [Bacteroidetes bacterium]|nr:phosphatase PAP2 family protein [Bacteroidota bacterium]